MVLSESCGVFGAYTEKEEVFSYLYWGMISQNHRGHQSHGFTTFNGNLECCTGIGLVPPLDKIGIKNQINILKGHVGIANVRYATSGPSYVEALQRDAMPIHVSRGGRSLAISFNGNIVNVRSLQKRVGIDESFSDTHALALLILNRLIDTGSITEAVQSCMEGIEGSFSVIGITDEGTLFAFKDPIGVKPLCYGCNESVHAVSSESVGLNINGLEFDHELEPGELMIFNEGKVIQKYVDKSRGRAFCAFEFAYFARPDSKFNDKYVYQVRKDFGVELARVYANKASRCNVVVSLPETANDAAYGFHEESALPWEMALRRHRYVTQRAFILGSEERENVIFRKINLLKPQIEKKSLAVVDDSIVRGDTTRVNIKRFKDAGAREIHLFITFPRIIGPCLYGIDMATFTELIGAYRGAEDIAEELGADSVNYLPIEEYIKATGMKREELCLGCITGEYPTPMVNKLVEEMKSRLKHGEAEKGRIYESL